VRGGRHSARSASTAAFALWARPSVLLAAGLAVLAALLVAFAQDAPARGPAEVVIGGQKVRVTVADTDALREKGLGGHAGLAPDEGMLFVFDADLRPGFWMKGMRFSIDILWIDRERRIVHIVPDLAPETYPALYAPPVPSRYVLELAAGFVRKHNVRVGDSVRW
jgi:uncharacterized membrane protein (UPF0127 family)